VVKYRIVPYGAYYWKIQHSYNNSNWTDVLEEFRPTSNIHLLPNKIRVFSDIERAKSTIDNFIWIDNHQEKIKSREQDKSLYIYYP